MCDCKCTCIKTSKKDKVRKRPYYRLDMNDYEKRQRHLEQMKQSNFRNKDKMQQKQMGYYYFKKELKSLLNLKVYD